MRGGCLADLCGNCFEDLCGVVNSASAQILRAVHISSQIKLEQFAFELCGIELCGDMVVRPQCYLRTNALKELANVGDKKMCGDMATRWNLDISAHFHQHSSALDISLHKRINTVHWKDRDLPPPDAFAAGHGSAHMLFVSPTRCCPFV